ncbi:MAG: hypothetical protein AVDCRST_MAG87-2085 [uncultured Thermomicrobiales bacterium]|uniref:Uncharacterized protein n=1 Tax=uncultured Thermomicrobiales bacterium TaxID=1645740 RepID=A0A6J4V7D2_9BACT|nr:MAG: hypothetical protein AVDCRST_MAG87-2085 [uncultured Thermomicrobiales bacterium]
MVFETNMAQRFIGPDQWPGEWSGSPVSVQLFGGRATAMTTSRMWNVALVLDYPQSPWSNVPI